MDGVRRLHVRHEGVAVGAVGGDPVRTGLGFAPVARRSVNAAVAADGMNGYHAVTVVGRQQKPAAAVSGHVAGLVAFEIDFSQQRQTTVAGIDSVTDDGRLRRVVRSHVQKAS